jgi:hypothetical protein
MNFTAERLALLLQAIPGSNLSLETGYRDRFSVSLSPSM